MPIEVKNLSFSYPSTGGWGEHILQDISFSLSSGEILGVLGKPGSGKSTLLQLLNGLLPAPENTIFIDGEDISQLTKEKTILLRRKVGLVMQFPEKQLFARTVYEDVAFGPENLGFPADETESRVKLGMEMAGLDYDVFSQRSPFGLSEGEKRKVALAGVFSIRTPYLLLDEPTAGLDQDAREIFFSTLLKLKNEYHTGIIMVTHVPRDMLAFADKAIFIQNGAAAATDDIFALMEALEKPDLLSGKFPCITKARELMYRLEAGGLQADKRVRNVSEAAASIYAALHSAGDVHV